MGDVATFPTIRNVLVYGDNIVQFTATTAVKAGMVVGINATGVAMAVDKCVTTAGEMPVGVALHDAGAGALVEVAMYGCVVYVVNALDGTNIDAGSWLETNDNAIGGTVSAVAVAASGSNVVVPHYGVIGIALDDNTATAAGAYSRMLICGPICVTQVNTN
jgi:hypothetical protein